MNKKEAIKYLLKNEAYHNTPWVEGYLDALEKVGTITEQEAEEILDIMRDALVGAELRDLISRALDLGTIQEEDAERLDAWVARHLHKEL